MAQNLLCWRIVPSLSPNVKANPNRTPVRCGLLADTRRQHLPGTGAVDERVFAVGELLGSPRVWLANFLRGLMPIRLEKTPRP